MINAVVLRENDYWQDLASVFNEVIYHNDHQSDAIKSAEADNDHAETSV